MEASERNCPNYESRTKMDNFSIGPDLNELEQQFDEVMERDVPDEPLDVENDAGNADFKQPPTYEDSTRHPRRHSRDRIHINQLDPDRDYSNASNLSQDNQQERGQAKKMRNGKTVTRFAVQQERQTAGPVISIPIAGTRINIVLDGGGKVGVMGNFGRKQTGSTKRDKKMEKEIPEPAIILTEEHIHVLSEYLGEKWQKLARAIGVEKGQIENILSDSALGSCKAQCRNMLEKWYGKYGKKATINFIIQSLKDLREYETAKRLVNVK